MNDSKVSIMALLSLIVAMLVWGSSFIALKSAIADTGAYSVIFLRMVVASVCFLYFIKDFTKYKFSRQDIKYILILSLLEPGLYFLFESNALKYTSASQAGIITSTMPIITAVAASWLLKEIITKNLIIGSVISMAGVLLSSLGAISTEASPYPLLGNLLEFGAMVCAAGYTIIVRHLSKKFSALFITAIQAFFGVIFFLPFFIYEISTQDVHFTQESIMWILYLGVVVTLGGYGLYNLALREINASQASVFVNLIPIFAILMGYLFLHETLTSMQIFASFFILFGVVITQIRKSAK